MDVATLFKRIRELNNVDARQPFDSSAGACQSITTDLALNLDFFLTFRYLTLLPLESPSLLVFNFSFM